MNKTYDSVAFTGTREGATLEQLRTLRKILTKHVRHGRHGRCYGADIDFHVIARSLKMRIAIHPSNVANTQVETVVDARVVHLPLPPIERDHIMVNCERWLIACPKGFVEEQFSGTWATVRYALKVGRRVTIIWPDGRVKDHPENPIINLQRLKSAWGINAGLSDVKESVS